MTVTSARLTTTSVGKNLQSNNPRRVIGGRFHPECRTLNFERSGQERLLDGSALLQVVLDSIQLRFVSAREELMECLRICPALRQRTSPPQERYSIQADAGLRDRCGAPEEGASSRVQSSNVGNGCDNARENSDARVKRNVI